MKKKVLIKGYFEKNLGDDIFVKILIERYKNINFEMHSKINYKKVYSSVNLKIYSNNSLIIIFKRFINLILMMIGSKKRVKLEDLINYDEIIIIGGSIFMENESFDINDYLNNKFRYNKEIYILGSNFGPYLTEEYINANRKIFSEKVSDICFRDISSYNMFSDLPNVRVAPDIVFGLEVEPKIIKENNKKVVISVIDCNKDNHNICDQNLYNNKISDLVQFFNDKNYEIVLMSFSQKQGDERIIEKIIELNPNVNILKYFYRGNINDAIAVINDCKIMIGTRFHANILGFILDKVVIPISYSDKTLNVLKDLNFNGKTIDITNINSFDPKSLTENDLNYKINVNFQKKESMKQFQILDELFQKK